MLSLGIEVLNSRYVNPPLNLPLKPITIIIHAYHLLSYMSQILLLIKPSSAI